MPEPIWIAAALVLVLGSGAIIGLIIWICLRREFRERDRRDAAKEQQVEQLLITKYHWGRPPRGGRRRRPPYLRGLSVWLAGGLGALAGWIAKRKAQTATAAVGSVAVVGLVAAGSQPQFPEEVRQPPTADPPVVGPPAADSPSSMTADRPQQLAPRPTGSIPASGAAGSPMAGVTDPSVPLLPPTLASLVPTLTDATIAAATPTITSVLPPDDPRCVLDVELDPRVGVCVPTIRR